MPLAPGDLPPVLDVEAANFHDVAVMRREVARWLRLVEAHYGVRPILYSNHSFYQRHLAGHFDDYPLWLAHYEVAAPHPAPQQVDNLAALRRSLRARHSRRGRFQRVSGQF